MERRQTLISILGGSINWLNIFVGSWQYLLKLNANVWSSRLTHRNLSDMYMYKEDIHCSIVIASVKFEHPHRRNIMKPIKIFFQGSETRYRTVQGKLGWKGRNNSNRNDCFSREVQWMDPFLLEKELGDWGSGGRLTSHCRPSVVFWGEGNIFKLCIHIA